MDFQQSVISLGPFHPQLPCCKGGSDICIILSLSSEPHTLTCSHSRSFQPLIPCDMCSPWKLCSGLLRGAPSWLLTPLPTPFLPCFQLSLVATLPGASLTGLNVSEESHGEDSPHYGLTGTVISGPPVILYVNAFLQWQAEIGPLDPLPIQGLQGGRAGLVLLPWGRPVHHTSRRPHFAGFTKPSPSLCLTLQSRKVTLCICSHWVLFDRSYFGFRGNF